MMETLKSFLTTLMKTMCPSGRSSVLIQRDNKYPSWM